MILLKVMIIVLLILLTAFFTSAEFAIVKIRPTRVDQLISEGNKKALRVKRMLNNVDSYLSAIQLGITVISLVLGWIGEGTVRQMLQPLFRYVPLHISVEHIISFIISFSVITFLEVVIGELAPKSLAIQKAEAITFFASGPLIWFYRIMYPFIWLLNSSSRLVTRLIGLPKASESEQAHSEEELRIIMSQSLKSGEINPSEFRYVTNVFNFDDKLAKEIMVPRTEITSFDEQACFDDIIATIKEEGYTRYPVTIDNDKDTIVGMINIKEVLIDYVEKRRVNSRLLNTYVHPVLKVIETIPVHDLLVKMQKEQTHMVILLDEYGGTAGLVTIEDILEEIVGEIRDEFDTDELPDVTRITDFHFRLDGKVLIEDVNRLFHIDITSDDIDTIGGWLLTQKYDLQQGDQIMYEHIQFTVDEMIESHVLYVDAINTHTEHPNVTSVHK